MADKNPIPKLGTGAIISPDGRPLSHFQGWLNRAFSKVEKSVTSLATQLGLIETAQATADSAEAKADLALSTIALFASDDLLTPVEKKFIMREVAILEEEQFDLDEKADLYGVPTTAYDAAISALTSYLATLTSPTAWNDLAGTTTIVGATFTAKFADAYSTAKLLRNAIYAAAKDGIDGAQAAAESAQDAADAAAVEAAANTAELAQIASDGVVSRGDEKRRAIREYNDILTAQTDDDAKATLYGIATEKTNYDTAITALTTYLGTLTYPTAWNIQSGNTNIVAATWNSKWSDVYAKRVLLLNKIAAEAKARADAAQTTANEAQADATTALTDLAQIASDNVLSRGEKPRVIREYADILAAQTDIDAKATGYGITTEKTNYDAAVTALTSYLGTLTSPVAWNNLTGDTTIVGTTFKTKFSDVELARQLLLNKIDEKAGTTATWPLVTGANKPADNATVGGRLGLNVLAEDGSTLLDDYAVLNTKLRIASSTTGKFKLQRQIGSSSYADLTDYNLSGSGIANLAYLNQADWASHIIGSGKPEDNATLGAKLDVNFKDSVGNMLYSRELLNDQLVADTDAGGTGGKGRVILKRPNGSGGYTNISVLTPDDTLQNKAITVASGILSGIGTSSVEVDNSRLSVDYDLGGTGSRARLLLKRNAGSTTLTTLELPSTVQNKDQAWSEVTGVGKAANFATNSDNILSNPLLLVDASGWTLTNGATRTAGGAGDALAFYFTSTSGGASAATATIQPVPAGSTLYISMNIKAAVAGNQFQVGVQWYDGTGAYITSTLFDAFPASTAWTSMEQAVTKPSNATHFNFYGTAAAANGRFGGFRFAPTQAAATVGGTVGTNVYDTDGVTPLPRINVANDALSFSTDTSGTGGRARLALNRGGTLYSHYELPAGLQNKDQVWTEVNSRPANLTALAGSEVINNANISVDGSGLIQGIGTGAGTAVKNTLINVDSNGDIQGIGTGAGTRIKNLAITVDGSGILQGIGTASKVVDNSKQLWSEVNSRPSNLSALAGTEVIQNQLITVASGILTGIGTSSIEVDNSRLTLTSDTGGTGGRARVLLNRNAGGTTLTTLELPSAAQNKDQAWADVQGLGRPADYSTSSDNVFPNPGLLVDSGGWTLANGATRTAATTSDPMAYYFTSASSNGSATTTLAPVPTGSSFYVQVQMLPAMSGNQFQWAIFWYDKNTTFISNTIFNAFPTSTSTWYTEENVLTKPANATQWYFTCVSAGANGKFGGFRLAPTQNGATKGAVLGTNTFDTDGSTVLGATALKNSSVSLNADGTINNAGGGAITFDSIGGASTYAKPLATEFSSGVPKLAVAGSGKQVGDSRNLPNVVAMNLGYKWTSAITYSSTTTSATISVAAATVPIGSVNISYNALSVGTSGSAGTTVTYFLYFDDATFAGGSPTLVATTTGTAVYQANGRVYVGTVDVVYPSSGTSGGGGSGGGGAACVAADAWVETFDRGFVPARKIQPGDSIRVLTDDGWGTTWELVTGNTPAPALGWLITSASGTAVTVSETTPITMRNGLTIRPDEIDGHELPIHDAPRGFRWEPCRAEPVGPIEVAHILVNQKTYAAGDVPGLAILTHNPKP